MELLQSLSLSNLQPFIDSPEQLVTQPIGFQIAVASYPETPRRLLEVLVNSPAPQIAEAAQLHVNWTGEMTEGWQSAVDEMLRSRQLGQNDRLAVELLKIAPVPEYFLSEWVPAERLIQGLRNPYLPSRHRLKLLERLAQEPTLEPRIEVAESSETPLAVLEQLAGDLELPIRLAVKFNHSCPLPLIDLVEGHHTIATDWNTDAEQLAMLGQSRWAWVRLAAAQNPSTPPDVLIQLAEDTIARVQLAVAHNPAASTAAINLLMNHADKVVRQAVAAHPNASEQVLLQLVSSYKSTIVSRTSLPVSVLEQLVGDRSLHYALIKKPSTPGSILEQVLDNPSEYQRAEIAQHPQVLVSSLEQLAQDTHPIVRLAVAQNLKTPEQLQFQLLEGLIAGSDEPIHVAIARDPNTPVTLLERLGGTSSTVDLIVDTIRQILPDASTSLIDAVRTFIANYQSPEQILFWLRQDAVFRDPILQAWRQLLTNLTQVDRTNLETLCRQMLPAVGLSGGVPSQARWLNQYGFPSPEFDLYVLMLLFRFTTGSGSRKGQAVAVALVGNLSTPVALREHLKSQLLEPLDNSGRCIHDCDVRLAVAFNPQTSELQRIEYLQQALSSGRNNIRQDIAKNPNTPVSILEQIAQRGAGGIQEVVKNPNAPLHILRQAAQIENSSGLSHTLQAVAENPNTPVDLLEELALNKGKYGVRETVLKNPRLNRLAVYKIQLKLQEQEEAVKASQELAKRPDSSYALAQVLEKGDRNARLTAARSLKTPIAVLEQLAKDPDETVRQAVAQNPHLPLNSLVELTHDPSVPVRRTLAGRKSDQESLGGIMERLADDESREVRTAVATNPNTPAHVLEKLAGDTEYLVKSWLSTNLNAPIAVLERLELESGIINERNPNVPGYVLAHAVNRLSRKKLADFIKHPVKGSQMPAETLAQLASHGDNSVRYRVASHPNTPTHALEQLARDAYVPTLRAIVENPNTPPYVLEQLANNPDLTTRLSIARNPNTPARTLAQIVQSSQTSGNVASQTVDTLKSAFPGDQNDVLRSLASNPRTPLDALEILARREFIGATPDPKSIIPPTTNDDVVRSLAHNPNLTPELLGMLTQDPCVDVRVSLVRHPNLTDFLWMRLAEDDALSVREAVATRAEAPKPVLERLAGDEQFEVRVKVAANPKTSIAVLEALAQDENAAVRAAVAANPNLPTAQLERLAQDDKVEVRRAVAQNPNAPAPIREALQDLVLQPTARQTSPTLRGLSRLYDPNTDDLATVLAEYAQSNNAFVRLVTLLHPLIPGQVLQQGAQSASWLERYAIADNPATSAQIRQQLAQDSNRIVRATARVYL